MSELGPEYLTVKALLVRPQSLLDDLKALLAQYTGDETVLELFQATRLSRFLPSRPLSPSLVEVAAYRYASSIIDYMSRNLPAKAKPIVDAYRSIIIVHDVELVISRLLTGRQLPSDEELISPSAPEVKAALKLAEEEATPETILSAAGFIEAAKLVKNAPELLSVALDVEILTRFKRALETVKLEDSKDLIGGRMDVTATRITHTLVLSDAPKSVVELYTRYLVGYKLPGERLADIAETKDSDALEALLRSASPYPIPEGLGALEGFIAAIRKRSRVLLARAYIGSVLQPDIAVPPLEQAILDAEDAVIIAIGGYSRQSKHNVSQLLSFTS